MTDTVLSSHKKEVIIGFERRFVMIGERINPTGRKKFQEQLRAGDYSALEADVQAQIAGGATMLDVNMGAPLIDEPEALATAAVAALAADTNNAPVAETVVSNNVAAASDWPSASNASAISVLPMIVLSAATSGECIGGRTTIVPPDRPLPT